MSEGGLSAKEAAIALGTDARTLRKFLRSSASPFEPVGQGSRYTFDEKEMKRLKKSFTAWGSGSKKKDEKPKPDEGVFLDANGGLLQGSDNYDVIDDDGNVMELDDLEGPSDEDLIEMEDLD